MDVRWKIIAGVLVKDLEMGRLSQIIWVGLRYSHVCPYKKQTEV